MTITKKLLLTLAIALACMLLVGGYAIKELHAAQQRFAYVQSETLPNLRVMQSTCARRGRHPGQYLAPCAGQ
jgi:methyl-accepting chemotaxis protein